MSTPHPAPHDDDTTPYDAFEISPVPPPGPDAVAPEPFHGLYGMPAFLTIPTADMTVSVDFWTRALGFFVLFEAPGHIVHLRRWAFQDVLLVPTAEPADGPARATLGVACVLSEIVPIVERCRAQDPSSVGEPRDTPWNTRDVEIVTPERTRVVLTAAKAYDPASAAARSLAEIGITPLREEERRA